jgi:hypothetical protein
MALGQSDLEMSRTPTSHSEIPGGWGWYYPDAPAARGLYLELQRELPPGHLLFGRPVETVAFRKDQHDVLFRHLDQPDRFTVIHLTWIRKREIDAHHPSVCFDGPFEQFAAEEQKKYELERADG